VATLLSLVSQDVGQHNQHHETELNLNIDVIKNRSGGKCFPSLAHHI